MLGEWNNWYRDAEPSRFQDSDTTTYELAAKFLQDMKEVEDWGCGFGGFKQFYTGKYIGVDGSKTPYVDVVADLRYYISYVDGIMMRHVLEHNYEWDKVLSNALASFRKKMCLILFTPYATETHEIKHNKDAGVDVPDLSFKQEDIETYLIGYRWALTSHKNEHIYFITKDKK
jgi:hypothetical protein